MNDKIKNIVDFSTWSRKISPENFERKYFVPFYGIQIQREIEVMGDSRNSNNAFQKINFHEED